MGVRYYYNTQRESGGGSLNKAGFPAALAHLALQMTASGCQWLPNAASRPKLPTLALACAAPAENGELFWALFLGTFSGLLGGATPYLHYSMYLRSEDAAVDHGGVKSSLEVNVISISFPYTETKAAELRHHQPAL